MFSANSSPLLHFVLFEMARLFETERAFVAILVAGDLGTCWGEGLKQIWREKIWGGYREKGNYHTVILT